MSEIDAKRLILQFETLLKDVNRQEINPKIPELKMDDLVPVAKMVANARANYLQALFDIAKGSHESRPSLEQIKKLKALREIYEELAEGSKALEIAMERGYLDIVT